MTMKTEGAVPPGPAARASGQGPARAGTVEQPSRADRVAQGKDARAVAPLESHAEFAPAGPRDPVGLLLEQAKSRVQVHAHDLRAVVRYCQGPPIVVDDVDTRSMNARDSNGERGGPAPSWHQVSSATQPTCVNLGRDACGAVRE
jgi:hypothetical protein